VLNLAKASERIKEQNQQLERSHSELKKAQHNLIQKEKMACLTRLVAGLAHEINTPLGICTTAISILEKQSQQLREIVNGGNISRSKFEDISCKTSESTELISNSLIRATKLVDRFKKVAADSLAYDKKLLNLEEHLNLFLATMTMRLKNVKVEVMCLNKIEIETFPTGLELVYRELISNSLTHSSFTDELIITFDLSQQDGSTYIDYQDSGKGIKHEILSEIFEPFTTTKRSLGSAGLGIYIAYNVVTQKLRGDLTCKNTINGGANFIIKLPIHKNNAEIKHDENTVYFKKEKLIDTKISFN
jgi:C4-dicarboxylate-specific signal transduction histidine kinase